MCMLHCCYLWRSLVLWPLSTSTLHRQGGEFCAMVLVGRWRGNRKSSCRRKKPNWKHCLLFCGWGTCSLVRNVAMIEDPAMFHRTAYEWDFVYVNAETVTMITDYEYTGPRNYKSNRCNWLSWWNHSSLADLTKNFMAGVLAPTKLIAE